MSLQFFCPAWFQHFLYSFLLLATWILYLLSDGKKSEQPKPQPSQSHHHEHIVMPVTIMICTTISKICSIFESLIEARYLRKRSASEDFRARTMTSYLTFLVIGAVVTFLSLFFWNQWIQDFEHTVVKSRAAWILANTSDGLILIISSCFAVFICRDNENR